MLFFFLEKAKKRWILYQNDSYRIYRSSSARLGLGIFFRWVKAKHNMPYVSTLRRGPLKWLWFLHVFTRFYSILYRISHKINENQ